MKSVLNQNPNNTEALNSLGYIFLQNNRIDEAKTLIEQAVALSPNNPAYLDSLGWLYYRQGNNDQAIKYLKKAYSLSNQAEIAAHLGEVFWKTGKQDLAKEIWEKAHSRSPDNETLKETMMRFKVEIKPIRIVNHD